jgi:two-component sensor histidine kinase
MTDGLGQGRGSTEGTIRVLLAKQEPDHLLPRVADSGAGLPRDFDLEKTTGLGMRIITALARTLDAKLTASITFSTASLRLPE